MFHNLTKTKGRRQALMGAAVVGALVLVLGLVKYVKISRAIAEHANFAPPPESITSAIAEELTWVHTVHSVGSLSAVNGATLSAEDPGRVSKVNFESGSDVTEGQVLVELDTTVEEADLAAAIARNEQAQKAFTREQAMRSNKITSQESLEKAQADARAASAQIDSLRAKIQRKKIVAPFSGRAGIRSVNVGQYVAAGTAVVPVHALKPLFIDFNVPESDYRSLNSQQKVQLQIGGFPGRTFEGFINAIDPNIDPSTRNIRVQAKIPNDDEVLRAGMFADISVIGSTSTKNITLPATSISYAPYGNSVFVIEPGKDPKGKDILTVRQQIVKVGDKRGDQVAILSGVKAGEQIASSGLFKLRPGAQVLVNNDFAPSNQPSPKPADT